jgi:AcrR family transcriptional regulator
VRTRRRFELAIRSLAARKPLEDITVRDICVCAGTGHHTFFRYFASLDDALALAHAQAGR